MSGAIIISVGDELLAGRIADSNAHWASNLLRLHGFPVQRRVTVPDNIDAIAASVQDAFESASVVLIGGGLGPTLDDITRDGLARAFGVSLRRDEAIAEHLRVRWLARARPVTESNLRQADVPEGFEALQNPIGTAPALLKFDGEKVLLAVAGVPAEFRALVEAHLLPRLTNLPTRGSVPFSRSLTICSIPESEIGERVKDLMLRGRDPEIGSYPRSGPVTLVMTSWDADPVVARAKVDADVAEIKRRFPAAHLPEPTTTPAESLVTMAIERGLRIAVAESITGGLVASEIVDVPNASRVLVGGVVTYATSSKTTWLGIRSEDIERDGVVSSEVARAMAENVRASVDADLGVATTGVAGPSDLNGVPVGTVWLGLAWRGGTQTQCLSLGGNREQIRRVAAARAVDLLRRYVAGVALSGP